MIKPVKKEEPEKKPKQPCNYPAVPAAFTRRPAKKPTPCNFHCLGEGRLACECARKPLAWRGPCVFLHGHGGNHICSQAQARLHREAAGARRAAACRVPAIQALEAGSLFEAEGHCLENYQARGMELEKDAMDARASFELACQEHSVAKERPLPLPPSNSNEFKSV